MSNKKAPLKEPTFSTITTTLRIPDAHYEQIKNLAEDIGDSANGTMLHLMFLGMKFYNGTFTIHHQSE